MPSKNNGKGKQRATSPPVRARRNRLALGNSPGHPIVLGSSPLAPRPRRSRNGVASSSSSSQSYPTLPSNPNVHNPWASMSSNEPSPSTWDSLARSSGWGEDSPFWRQDGRPINFQDDNPARLTLSSASRRILRSQVARQRLPSPVAPPPSVADAASVSPSLAPPVTSLAPPVTITHTEEEPTLGEIRQRAADAAESRRVAALAEAAHHLEESLKYESYVLQF